MPPPSPNKLRKQPPARRQPLSLNLDPCSGPATLPSRSPSPSRKLTKRRRPSAPHAYTVPLSSSAAAAYAASAAMPPTYTQSDIGHGTSPAASPASTSKRSSIIRRFSFRSSDPPVSSWRVVASTSKGKSKRWGSSASEHGHSTVDDPAFLPHVRAVSPFSLTMPPNDRALSLPDDFPPPRSRPKFTLSDDSEADLSSPPPSSTHHSTDGSHASLARLARPRLVRRDANVGTAAYGTQRRRWTLATAMTDEGITDEVLVEELEKMFLYAHADWTGSVDDLSFGIDVWDEDVGRDIWGLSDHGHARNRLFHRSVHDSPISEGVPTVLEGIPYAPERTPSAPERTPSAPERIPYTPSLPSFPLQHRLSTPVSASASWQTARRALLTCRELVRTERHYLVSLQSLLASETDAPPPPLMLRYVGELVKVSATLLGRMEENPSAWGIAAAFLGKEEGVEAAYVSWCGVVGSWFTGPGEVERPSGSGSRSRKSSSSRRQASRTTDGEEELPAASPLKRTVSAWRKSMSNLEMTSVSSGGAQAPSPVFSGFLSSGKRKDSKEKRDAASPPEKRKPPVRDLAILPTQRVMRYVLLYRDLLAHTPSTSPSRAIVERAVQAACRIAQKCDRAQGNAAFFTGTQAASVPNNITGQKSFMGRRKLAISIGATPAPRMGRSDQAKNAEW